MYRAGRTAWGLVAVGAATAVGITTQNPGFVVITFLGALVVPRVLGLTPRRWNKHGFGPHGAASGRGCSGAGRGTKDAETSTPTAQSV
ncbi:MAG: hypothetical protein QOE18_1069 [Chloroflexota bacterium]|jgi:hypothetical protein|nr:hypothetical protein [Chloroflexota bacterium]